MADLRRSHFKVGHVPQNMATHYKTTYTRPSTAHPSKNESTLKNRGAELRMNNWTLGDEKHQPAVTSFVTSNMLNFKWIQPKPINEI